MPTPDEILANYEESLKRPWHHPAATKVLVASLREALRQRDIAVKALERIAPADNDVARWAQRALKELQKAEEK